MVQAEVPPVSQALAQFTELITRNSLHADINARSLNKLFELMDSIVQSSEAYPPARAERLTFLINRLDCIAAGAKAATLASS